MFRAIGPVLLRSGQQVVAPPCLALIVSSFLCFHVGCPADGDVLPVVDQNPKAFVDAYWEVNSLRIYTPAVT